MAKGNDKYSVRGQTSKRGLERAMKHQGGYAEEGGSHTKWYTADGKGSVPIPRHNEVNRNTMRGIIVTCLFIGFIMMLCVCFGTALMDFDTTTVEGGVNAAAVVDWGSW